MSFYSLCSLKGVNQQKFVATLQVQTILILLQQQDHRVENVKKSGIQRSRTVFLKGKYQHILKFLQIVHRPINTLFIALFINFQPTVSSRTPGASKTAKYILSHLIKYDIRSLNKIIAATTRMHIQHVFIMPIVLNSLKVTELLLLLLQSIKQPARQKISKHVTQDLM